MAIKSEALIYKILEQHIKNSEHPITCAELWERADVSSNAKSIEKVSDHLGLMWRRGLLQRWSVPASSISKARYAYTWKEQQEQITQISNIPLKSVRNSYVKTNVTVTEDGDRLILDFDKFTMTIQSKE